MKMPRLSLAMLSSLVMAACLPLASAHAQGFPDKPIKIVVPYSAGGGGDILARMFAEQLRDRLGQPVIVENKPGAGTLIGSEYVAKSPADGYTLLLTTNSLLIAPILNASAAKFDPVKDFAPVVPIGSIAIILVANPSLPANNAAELVSYLKKNPGKVSFASAGAGGITHLSGELFKMRTGVDMVHVPYKGAAPALTDLMGGQVGLLFDAVITAYPHVKSGKLKAIGMGNATRWAGAPDVPTIAESGVPDFKVSGWYGVLAPAGTPPKVLERLNAEANAIIKDPEFALKLRDKGLTPMGGSLEQYRATVQEDHATWQKVIKDGNITLQ
jgi:tripartite-type tricarboxylate transporter receptor subunit TctC